MARKPSIKNLKNARRAKNDKFYAQYGDAQEEIEKMRLKIYGQKT